MPQPVTLEKAAELVAAFVSNNPLPRGELPALIQAIHDTLARLSAGVENSTPKEELKEPAVSIRKSVTPEYLICLEDGKHFKSLKRHLAAHGLTPEQYRAKWKLPSELSHGCRQLRGDAVGDGESDWSWTVARKRRSAQTGTPAKGRSRLIRIAADPR